jgi:4-amino-4-deoxy-L-arabinose transferase-like glycosyltransferase
LLIPGLLPFACWALAFTAFRKRADWRTAALAAALLEGSFVALGTELLGAFGLLSRGWLILFWLVVCAGLLVATARHVTTDLRGVRPPELRWGSWQGTVITSIFALTLVAGVTATIALVAPPNTYDAMTYHLARVAHWAAQHSVADYPTGILRQLYQPPWAEYQVLHFQLLTGGDRLANLVQWCSLVGSAVAVSAIAAELRVGLRGQLVASVFALTLPMSILQASSTQNDLVVAFWLASGVYFAIRLGRHPSLATALAVGASLGLATLTKGTALVYALPLLVGVAVVVVRRLGVQSWRPALVLVIAVVALNAGFWARNQALFGTPLGSPQETARYQNAVISPQIVASNLVRDAALQVGLPSGPANSWMEDLIRRVHGGLGIDVNDPRDTWRGTAFHVNPLSTNEDLAGNPLGFGLLVVVGALVLVAPPLRRHTLWVLYLAGLVVACLLFAATLKWQPWHSRLELPLLVLAAPLCGAVTGAGRATLPPALILVLTIAAMPWLVLNETRPLVGSGSILVTPRLDLYFVQNRELEQPYRDAAAWLQARGCRTVGFVSGEDAWEYPLWVLMGRDAQLVHVLPDNESAGLQQRAPAPCAIVALGLGPDRTSIEARGAIFSRTVTFDPVTIFSPS